MTKPSAEDQKGKREERASKISKEEKVEPKLGSKDEEEKDLDFPSLEEIPQARILYRSKKRKGGIFNVHLMS
jgi:hypothetical protein